MKTDKITLSMGAGGKLSGELIEEVFLSGYGNKILEKMDDSAELELKGLKIAFTTDSYTVKPLFFPGGDIGKLSICGTCNDLAVKGAKPVALSASVIIEEGFLLEDLKKIAVSRKKTADKSGVRIVTGDTKVVGRGEADGIFINTSGIGMILPGMNVSCSNVKKGDVIIISGSIGDHGASVMNAREKLGFYPEIKSDVAPVYRMIEEISAFGNKIHAMRDPTRGGLASVLNEIARASKVKISVTEKNIPVNPAVRKFCDLLGFDPLYVANEGKVVIFSSPDISGKILKIIKRLPEGKNANIIGSADESDFSEETPAVSLKTLIGTKRFVPFMEGEQLPRIC